MTWAGTSSSGLFWTINTGDGIARVDWEPPGGDVSGVIDNLIVIGIRGEEISSSLPASGDVLHYNGQQWSPIGTAILSTPHNLLSSTHSDTIVASPSDGDIIVGSGSSWAGFSKGYSGDILSINDSGQIEWAPPRPDAFRIITSGTNVQLDYSDKNIIVKKSTGAPTNIYMPASPYLGQNLIIKDGKGDAGPPQENHITVSASGTTIDGNYSIVMSRNYQSFTLMWNGDEWNIV